MPTPNNQNNDISSIATRIDLLIETINKQFSDVRGEMREGMDRYVLQAVHDLEIKRLNEKDETQQRQLDELEARVMGTTQRYLINAAAVIGGLGGLAALLHTLHLL